MNEEKNLWEDFTTLRWVKWTTRKPQDSSAYVFRWNDKWTSQGTVMNECLITLDDMKTKTTVIDGKVVADYTQEQLEILENLYWLEETFDNEGFDKYQRQ